ncbi:MAG: hypothetical protein WCO00_18450 [Rhodospirillaceae bacterium]
MVNRTPAAVSKWIREGKLHGPALVGDGRGAQIDVDVALGQLGVSLDLGQQLAQSQPVIGRATTAPVEAAPLPDDQARLLKARADREELALQVDGARAAELEGRWMPTDDARDEWSRQLAELVQAVETWLVTGAASDVLAVAVAGAGPREFGRVLRDGFRQLRQRLADQAARADAQTIDEADDDENEEAMACV